MSNFGQDSNYGEQGGGYDQAYYDGGMQGPNYGYGGQQNNGGYYMDENMDSGAGQQQHGVGEFAVEEMPEEGIWSNQTSALFDDENNSVTALMYDDNYERLWAGYRNGRVLSLLYSENESTGRVEMNRYSSFLSGKNSDSVFSIHPVQEYIVSTSGSSIRMHTDGGIAMGSIKSQEMIVSPGAPADSVQFRCTTLYSNDGGMMMSTPVLPSHIIAGTKKNIAMAYDMAIFGDKPLLTYDVKSPTECITQSAMYMVAGGYDGHVRLLDSRLRSSVVQHTLKAHSGPLLDICLQPNDYTLYTCGKVARDINPHDPNSPKKMVPDPLVRVFDLRMNRQLAPLSMTTASPTLIKFVPASSSRGGYGTNILLGSSNGMIQICDPMALQERGGIADPTCAQYLYATLNSPRDTVMSAAVSSSGQVLCTGNYSGGISQFALGQPLRENGTVPSRTVNEVSSDILPFTEAPSPPPLRLHVEKSDVLSTAYSLNVSAQHVSSLSSSYTHTPKSMTKTLKLFSKQLISQDLTQDMKKSDFIGFIPNPGFKPNSMLTSSAVDGKRAYAVCDPRKRPEGVLESEAVTGTTSTAGMLDDGTAGIGIIAGGYALPSYYQRQQSYRGKQRMHRFDYTSLNATNMVALENTAPNAYTNTVLQFMAAIPAMRQYAIKSQASLYHHNNPHTLWCELGFFFHMVNAIDKEIADEEGTVVEEEATQRVVTPSNFQRTFQCIPEAVALGLFDGSLLTVQAMVQVFLRFFLTQLHKESYLESARSGGAGSSQHQSSVISDIFGFSIVSVTQFLQSGTQETGVPNQAFTFDLVYPSASGAALRKRNTSTQQLSTMNTSGNTATNNFDQATENAKLPPAEPKSADTPASFASAVWGSLRKETSMKGWCDASKSYEPFKQVRSMVTMPQILTFLCGETTKDPLGSTISGALGELKSQGSMHEQYWSNKYDNGGCWLPMCIEVAIFRPEDPKAPSRLIVSSLMSRERCKDEVWAIFDGVADKIASGPASSVQGYGITTENTSAEAAAASTSQFGETNSSASMLKAGWTTRFLELSAVISQVNACENASMIQQHAVIHARRKDGRSNRQDEPDKDWVMCNDLCLRYSDSEDVVTFDTWRHPCVVFYTQVEYGYGVAAAREDRDSGSETTLVPASVLQLPSSSTVACERLTSSDIPVAGQMVAFDGEFVSVALEQADTNADGQKVLVHEARQNLARYSLIDGGVPGEGQQVQVDKVRILADDYIIPSETIVDYLTRFSGIVAEDLQPAVSRNAVVPNRTAYLKLRFFADNGCIFVGHGLDKDFQTANIFVPRSQVIDTVELWRLPMQRKMSLRFLAAYVLKEDIQDEIHDSIEDAKTALLLYRSYQRVAAKGFNHLQVVLQEMYAYGTKTNWSIRQDLIEEHFEQAKEQIEVLPDMKKA